MTTPLTADVQFTSHGLATSIALPTRPPSPIRFFGCVPMFIGAVLFFMAFGWAFALLTGLHNAPPPPLEGPAPRGSPEYFLALFTIPVFLAAQWFVYVGLRVVLPNRIRIEITDAELRLITKAGPFPKTRKRPLAEIAQIRIADAYPGLQFPAGPGEPPRSSCLIDCKTQRMLVIAGYYKDTITAAANLIVDELRRRHLPIERPSLEAPPAEQAVSIAMTPSQETQQPPAQSPLPSEPSPPEPQELAPPAAPPSQPATSTISYLPAADSLTFIVPRTGVKGVAVFFLLFSLVWNSISGLIFIVFLGVFLSHPTLEDVLPLLFISLFLAIGFVMFLAFLQTAFRKAVIVASPGSLVVTQQGPIRSREFQWEPGLIKTIETDYSGTTINSRRLRELRVQLTSGAHESFFDGRDDDELAWLAGTLRHYYRL